LVSADGVAPSRMVGVSASVNLFLHSRSSLLAPAYPGGPGKRAVKQLWWRCDHATLEECRVPIYVHDHQFVKGVF